MLQVVGQNLVDISGMGNKQESAMSVEKREKLVEQSLTLRELNVEAIGNPGLEDIEYLDKAEVENFLDIYKQEVIEIFDLIDDLSLEHLDNLNKAYDRLYDLKEKLY